MENLRKDFETKADTHPDELYFWVEENLIIPHHHLWYEKVACGDGEYHKFDEVSWFINQQKNKKELWESLDSFLKTLK